MSLAFDMNEAVWWLRKNQPERLIGFKTKFSSIRQSIKSVATGESISVVIDPDWEFDVMGFFEDEDGLGVALVTFYEEDIKYLATTLKGATDTFKGMDALIEDALNFDGAVDQEVAISDIAGGAPWA